MISWPLVKQELKDLRWIALIGTLIAALSGVALPFIYKPFMENVINGMDPDLRGFLGVYKDFTYYFWAGWFGKSLIQVGGLFAIIFGAGLIAGDRLKGNLEFLYSKPFSRQTILLSKCAARALVLFALIAVSTLLVCITVFASGNSLPLDKLITGTIFSFIVILFLFSLTAFFSVDSKRPLTAGLFTALFLVISSIPAMLPDYQKYSPYYYMQGWPILKGEGFPWLATIAFVGLSVIFLKLAEFRLNKLDL